MAEARHTTTGEEYARALAEDNYAAQAGILLAVMRGLRRGTPTIGVQIAERVADEILDAEDAVDQRRAVDRAADELGVDLDAASRSALERAGLAGPGVEEFERRDPFAGPFPAKDLTGYLYDHESEGS